jgi:hypothetical protein
MVFSVISEVNRKPDRADDYLELAKHLQPILAKIDGFIDNERFESAVRRGWLLSLDLEGREVRDPLAPSTV